MNSTPQSENPKFDLGIRKPCLSNLPLFVIGVLCEEMKMFKRSRSFQELADENTVSAHLNMITKFMIAFYDKGVNTYANDNTSSYMDSIMASLCVAVVMMEKILSGTIIDNRSEEKALVDYQSCCDIQDALHKKYPNPARKYTNIDDFNCTELCTEITNQVKQYFYSFDVTSFSMEILFPLSLAMSEGALKYGKHNYRDSEHKILVSTYIDAVFRHVLQFWSYHEDIDVESKLHHGFKIMACLVVLYDSILNRNAKDDRPIRSV